MNVRFTFSLLALVLSSLLFTACKANEDISDIESDIDSTDIEVFVQGDDILESFETLNEEASLDEQNESEKIRAEIVEKFGEQWDFCVCIVKSDSVNTALMETDDDDEFDLIMERSDFIDSKCKEMLLQPNSTPEDRAKHEQRVKRCLANS